MTRNIRFTTKGQRAGIGEYIINRILPNRKGAHPHRGIATLTYILNGESEHFDSYGNHAKVSSGGAQWMKRSICDEHAS